jgi:SAM-dependent methyltransferase
VTVVEDIPFYVELALEAAPGPVVELGVGTGRVAVPTAEAGVRVIGVDSSLGMLQVCAVRAEEAGVSELLDLRLGDLREPPVRERVDLVTTPFRALLHMHTDENRLKALRAVRDLLKPQGRFAFDVFAPGQEDIRETNGRWIEREPGIYEKADWDEGERTLTLSVRGPSGETTMALAWLSQIEWYRLLDLAGFDVEGCYGWFDGRPFVGGEDMVFVCRRRA